MTEPGSGNILDSGPAMARADSGDMLGAIAGLPRQVAEGRELAQAPELPWPTPRSVALLGMGGSAISGDLVAGIYADQLTVPLEVLRGYTLPAWVGSETLVVASSRSGGTEETLRQLEVALQRRCSVVCVTAGGALLNVARAARLPLVTFPDRHSPRASLGWSLGILAGILERAGVLALEDAEVVEGVADAEAMVARCEPSVPTADNPAKQLAWSLVDRLVVVAASGALAPVARRWKTQLNENAKVFAAVEPLPEATHNTVVGLEGPEILRDHLGLVLLRGRWDHPRDVIRAQLVGDVADAGHIWHTVVETSGSSVLGQALSAIVLGDYTSVYLAFMYGMDPTPVDVIDHIKGQLKQADTSAAE